MRGTNARKWVEHPLQNPHPVRPLAAVWKRPPPALLLTLAPNRIQTANTQASSFNHLTHLTIQHSFAYTPPIHFRSSHTALIEVRLRRSKTFFAAAIIFPFF